VITVGFMAQHTLGRRLVEGRRKVKVFGVDREVAAEVHVLDGLSAHADRNGLVAYVRRTAERGRLVRVALVHGEDEARYALGEALRELGIPEIIQPAPGKRVEL
jgi:metallo-beta-lactamase family protein